MNATKTRFTQKQANEDQLTDQDRIRAITATIKNADRRLRDRHLWLRHQDTLGVGILVAMIAVCAATTYAYLIGILTVWVVVIVNAFCLAIVREIEHDLVHDLYFRECTWAQNAMMWAVWPCLGNLPHPWFRREIHLLHHRTSGHDEDLEERLIGNGMPFGALKLLAMIDPVLAMQFRKKELEEIPFYDAKKVNVACFPVVFFYYAVLAGFALLQLASGLAAAFDWTLPTVVVDISGLVTAIAVTWVFPNMLRQTSVQVLSSWMHYYGDVETRLHETQVMNAWYLLPLNLFSANFGSTHSIHHFYAKQPFYLRQMVAAEAHAAFEKYGVRYNDAASVLRGNRFSMT